MLDKIRVELFKQELQKTKNRFDKVQKIAHLGIWELNLQTNTLYWSDEVFKIFEIESKQFGLSSESFFSTIHPEDRKMVNDAYRKHLSNRITYDIVHRLLMSDGRIKYVREQCESFYDDDGTPVLSEGIVQDITSLKQVELERTRYRALMAHAGDAILLADSQGNLIEGNRQAEELLGYSQEELTHLHISQIHPQEISEAVHKHFQEEVVLKNEPCRLETLVLRKDGSQIPVEIRSSLIQLNGELIAQGIFRNIQERKQAEQIIQQQAKKEVLLREITQRIRQSLDLQTIFDTACQEIRQVLQADRVGIFKFYPESNFDDGEFVAEAVVEGFSSAIGVRVHDHCFGENYSSLYAKGKFYAVDDIYHNGLTVCHSDLLAQFQVKANLLIPLNYGLDLWGLLCIHQCSSTRHWSEWEIDLTQQLSNQLTIAIQQASLYDQIQSELLLRQQAEANIALKLRQQETLSTITQQVRESLDVKQILEVVTQQVKDILSADRVIVFQLFPDGRSQIVEEAVSSDFPKLKDCHWLDEVWSQDILDHYWQGQPRIVPDVMNDIWTSCLVEYSNAGQIQSKIVAPILQDLKEDGENHRWVAEWNRHKLWGILVVHACREKRVWQESEAQLLQQIANQLAIAIQQSNLFKKLQEELIERQQAQEELTQRNQQLARATRLKDEFLANMSHELRTPLNAILGMTEALQEEVFGSLNAQQIKALQTVESSSSHLLSLINDILDVAKIESGQFEPEYSSVPLLPLCSSGLAFIKQQAFKKGIQLEIKVSPNLPNLLVDERRIRQVLINLLSNAVKFTPSGGLITLKASLLPRAEDSQKNYLRLAVIDTGIGIASNNIKKLFQPFVQIDSKLNRQYTGTGLGLSLVKQIVELHGGEVGVTSELGVGSCFTIDLPCEENNYFHPNSTLPTPDGETGSDPSYPSHLILLADDNEINVYTIKSYLKAKGYRLLIAKNGQEAIDLARSEHPDLILMDIQMPGMNGLEAMQIIRRDALLVSVPIIALTALAMTGDRERCLAAGANEYLAKPVKLRQLAIVIQSLLQQILIK